MNACPCRVDFFNKLKVDPAGGPPATDEQLDEGLNKWLTALTASLLGCKRSTKLVDTTKGFSLGLRYAFE